MGASLIQPYGMREEGYFGCKPRDPEQEKDLIWGKSPGQLRASSRGKTRGASVIQDDWA